MYVEAEGDLSTADIAKAFGVTKGTADRWCGRGKWTAKREHRRAEKQRLRQEAADHETAEVAARRSGELERMRAEAPPRQARIAAAIQAALAAHIQDAQKAGRRLEVQTIQRIAAAHRNAVETERAALGLNVIGPETAGPPPSVRGTLLGPEPDDSSSNDCTAANSDPPAGRAPGCDDA